MPKNENIIPSYVLEIFGIRLRNLRKLHNKTQEEMSLILELSRSFYGNLEAGHGIPSLNTLYRIIEYFNCSYDYLLGRTNTKTGYFSQETNLIKLIMETDDLKFDDIDITYEDKTKIINAFKHALSILKNN